MPLIPAEMLQKHEEKLKSEHPEIYKEIKRLAAERALLYYTYRESKYTKKEKEELDQKWRDGIKHKMSLTPAEKEKMKKKNLKRYEVIKKVEERWLLYCRYRGSKYTDEEKEDLKQKWKEEKKMQIGLTPAKKQEMKRENPERYKLMKNVASERMLVYCRNKVSQYTEKEKEEQKQKWRDEIKNMSLTPAEKQKMKRVNPEKKVFSEPLHPYFRKKVSKYTEKEKEELKQQWEDERSKKEISMHINFESTKLCKENQECKSELQRKFEGLNLCVEQNIFTTVNET